MIPRYSPKDISAIWTEDAKFQRWLQLEIAAVEARMEAGLVPAAALSTIKQNASFKVAEILEIEKETKHDVIAFLTNVAGYVGPDSRYIHEGLTSSDVVDTCLAMQMRDAGIILVADIEQLIAVLAKRAVEFKYTLEMGRTHGIHAEAITLDMSEMIQRKEKIIADIGHKMSALFQQHKVGYIQAKALLLNNRQVEGIFDVITILHVSISMS